MSPIARNPAVIIVCLIASLALAACGSSTPNNNATFDSEKGTHPADWFPKKHKDAALADLSICKECHGEGMNGGGINSSAGAVDCSQCHLGGPASAHPLDWQDNSDAPAGAIKHRWYVLQNSTVSCANQYCHAANLGGVETSGVSCKSCHLNLIPQKDNCTFCHGFPPDDGKHSQHVALKDIDCSVCHLTNHAFKEGSSHSGSGVLLNFLLTYTAKSGAIASFNSTAKTCSKVSCHGGQTTPDWNSSATFDIDSQCSSCHGLGTSAGDPEYNSYYSGHHDHHVNEEGISCTSCHSSTKLANTHFTSLSTSALEGPASATINDALQYNAGSCSPSGCHETRNWFHGD